MGSAYTKAKKFPIKKRLRHAMNILVYGLEGVKLVHMDDIDLIARRDQSFIWKWRTGMTVNLRSARTYEKFARMLSNKRPTTLVEAKALLKKIIDKFSDEPDHNIFLWTKFDRLHIPKYLDERDHNGSINKDYLDAELNPWEFGAKRIHKKDIDGIAVNNYLRKIGSVWRVNVKSTKHIR